MIKESACVQVYDIRAPAGAAFGPLAPQATRKSFGQSIERLRPFKNNLVDICQDG